MTRARQQDGFTLIELLVTMTISVIVFGATLSVLDVFQKDNRFEILRNETGDNARSTMDRLGRDIRNVAAPSAGYAGALEQAEPYSLTFQAIDSSRAAAGENRINLMRVRYCLDDSNPNNELLWRQVKRWETKGAPPLPGATACPDLSGSDWDTSEQLVQHVSNRIGGRERPLFQYGPVGASTVAQIISVAPTVFIDLNPGGRPGEAQLTSSIFLRNENRTPVASFTAEQRGTTRVFLNASESTDPNGLALTYTWWQDSTLLSTTAQRYETPPLVEGKHTFKLEVTNPGGLSNTTERSVTITP